MMQYDGIIIGGGPAGMFAAITAGSTRNSMESVLLVG